MYFKQRHKLVIGSKILSSTMVKRMQALME